MFVITCLKETVGPGLITRSKVFKHFPGMQIPIATFSLATIQFPAILGGLSHQTDVYLSRQTFSELTTCLFTSCELSDFVLRNCPDLLPPGEYNNHSIGVFFQFAYYSNLTFRFAYLSALPSLGCVC